MSSVSSYIAVPVVLLMLLAIYVWWSLRTKTTTKGKRVVDFIFLWPIALQGHRTNREKIAIWVGIVIASLLICWSFTLPKP